MMVFFNKYSRISRSTATINLPDFSRYSKIAERMGKINIPDFNKYSKISESTATISLPDFTRYSKIAERMGKINIPDFNKYSRIAESTATISLPDFSRYSKIVERMGKINIPDFNKYSRIAKSTATINLPSFDKILSISESLSSFPNKVSNIDWENFELTEEILKEANEVINSENPAEQVTKELDDNKSSWEAIKAIIVFIIIFIGFLSDSINIYIFSEERIYPAMQAFHENLTEDKFNSDREALNWLNGELKKDASQQITKNFRIVKTDDFSVREGKTVNSKIMGKLDHGDVVQIVEKKRNWTYIQFSNHEDSEYIEGWVLTRYLKQIK